MATAKKEKKLTPAIPENDFEEEGMVFVEPPEEPKRKKTVAEEEMEDSLTMTLPPEEKKKTETTVEVFLPRLEDDGSIKVDQYEHVTIANENGEAIRYRVLRGERVSIPIRVFMFLHEKYGKAI